MRFTKVLLAVFVAILIASSLVQAKECRLMRYPDIHKDKIAFTYGGDLWVVSSQGGVARKLTSHPGEEVFPKFSPDGKYIAFTGEYEGGTHVYVMPAEGGEPRQITFHPDIFDVPERMGYNDQIIEWYPDGKKLLFRSRRESHRASGSKLFGIDADGGFPEVLKIPESGLASFSPDGNKLAYNRGFREFRTWKRYKGGLAQDVWIYDLKNNKVEQITDWEGTDSSPMWHENKIYFNSDRDHTLNIFSYDVNTKKTKKVTNHKDYDVKWPSIGPGFIVYENGGYLYVLNLETEDSKKISVEVPGDVILTRPNYENVSDLIQSASLSPAGKRAVFSARGDIFTVPAEKGNARNITQTQGIREISPVWSPDGKWVAYLSDRTGEYDIYIRPQDGEGEEERITRDGDCYRFDLKWSPDSKKILWTDKKMRLFYVDIEDKDPVMVDEAKYTQIWVANWSPDSKWITYTKNEAHFYEAIYLYNLDEKKPYKITDDLTDDINPVFDPDGKYLYFISLRSFAPTFSDFEQEYIYSNTRNIYLMTLQADSLSPFAPESDEAEVKEEEKEEDKDKEDNGKEEEEKKDNDKEKGKEEKKEDKDKDKEKDIKIDLANIDQRIVGIPVPSGNYAALNAAEGKIFYMSYPGEGREGGPQGPQGTLHMYDLKEKEHKTILSGINGYGLSSDGKKIIYTARQSWGIIDAKESKVGDGSLNLSELEMKVDPRAEWEQIFNEAWRLERDFFYDPDMHGVDWDMMKKRYGDLLPYVAHRSDLTYIIGEMIGELCTSHTYVGGGKKPRIDRYWVGLLGCDFEVDPDVSYYRFKKIYKGENWKDDRTAPLTEPGVVVNEGDYLIAVNGKEIKYPENPFVHFEKTAGKQVKIKVNSKPTAEEAKEYTVKPVSSDGELRYLDWVETNRKKVDEATNGRVGYVHVPNTSISGLNEFSRGFFGQVRKEGLIVDVRNNAGGMIPDMFLERLQRRLLSLWWPREGQLGRTPSKAFHGPMACIINEYAGSGGDAFPYYFRELGLGPLIGNRTWGGLVGISRGIPLMDGGYVTCPEFAFINLEGQWDVENHGVDPDIPIDNRPDLVAKGQDPQLEKAIEYVMDKLEKEPVKLPPRPPFPVKR